MDGHSVHNTLVAIGPWIVLGVGAVSVALTGVAFAVFLITHLLGGKPDAHHGHSGGHAHH